MKLFAIPVLFKLITHYLIGVAALSCVAYAGEMPAATMQGQATLDSMSHGKAMNDCFPCALCCVALPNSTKTTGSDDRPDLASATPILWRDPVVRSTAIYTCVARCSNVALRIMYCCWRN